MDAKKLLQFGLYAAGGYLAYEYLIKPQLDKNKKPVKTNKPALAPAQKKAKDKPISDRNKKELENLPGGNNRMMSNLPSNIGEDMLADGLEDML